MEIDKREQEQRDWEGYGSAERPVVVTFYHVQDDHEVHRLLSINDYAIWDLFGDQATFELHLAGRYRSVELVGSGKVIVKLADQRAILAEGAQEIKRRIEELQAKHPGIRSEPWLPERLDQQKVDKTVPPTTVPDDPSVPNDSPEKSNNELLAAISRAIFDRIAPVVAGTMKQGGPADLAPLKEGFMWLRITPKEMSDLFGASPAEADVVAAVAMFPASVRALITTRVDARVNISHRADSITVSVTQCRQSEFVLSELSEPYAATDALHLVFDSATDTGSTFVMVEFTAGNFNPRGWVDSETAARCAAEGARNAKGRPPDFRGTTGKSQR